MPKATSLSSPEVASLAASTSIHQSLHHPNIVSLFSSFSTSIADYHILELCTRGTLSDFLHSRSSPILFESELRGVLKSLVDALLYLRKELVIYRDLKPANILLTQDYRIVRSSVT
jgi:polo-like kinase 4